MSLVESAVEPAQEPNSLPEKEPSAAGLIVAPTLRVEELKDDEGHSSSGYSEEEGVLSHGDEKKSPTSSPVPKQEAEFVPPDEELKNKIIQQVEFYFGDANILKDAFLLKHVRRNKMGYVSLKLITSFRKLKSLTKDYRVVAYSLRQSDQLEVNEEGTKVRRQKPLPDYDETTPSRTVVAVNLPFENPTIENVAELFKPCGDIALIRVLRPGKTIPPDVKKHVSKHPELDSVVCAVVEFEQHDAAIKAIAQLNNSDDWRHGLRVVLLGGKKVNDKAKNKDAADIAAKENANDTEDGSPSRDQQSNKKKKNNKKKRSSRVEELAHEERESPSSGSEAETGADDNLGSGEPQRRRSTGTRVSLSPCQDQVSNRLSPTAPQRSSPRTTPRSSPRSSPRGSPNMRRKMHGKSPLVSGDTLSPGTSPRPSPAASPETARRRKSSVEMGTSPGGSPWVQRRLKAQQEASTLGSSPGASPRLGRRLLDLEGVIRQPKGPDGTTGFHPGVGRGKPITVDSA